MTNFAAFQQNFFEGYTGWEIAKTVFGGLSFLFMVGSLLGWITEVLFRRFFSAKKWINPGFLTGPCLPIYGFGVVALFCLCLLRYVNPIPESVANYTFWWDVCIILFIGAAMTLIELIAGLVFVKGMNIRLWDYSKRPGNFRGIICPLFSFLWTAAGAVFLYLLFPLLVQTVEWFFENTSFLFFVGMFYGVFAVDVAYSFDIANKLKKFAKENKMLLRFEKLKESIAAQLAEKNLKRTFVFSFRSPEGLKKHLEKFALEEKLSLEAWQEKRALRAKKKAEKKSNRK